MEEVMIKDAGVNKLGKRGKILCFSPKIISELK